MEKTIITVIGKDKVGIMAKVCTYLADNNVNVLDISQTIVEGFFNMMMIADISDSTKSIIELSEEITEIGSKIGVQIRMQSEKIFNSMHRL